MTKLLKIIKSENSKKKYDAYFLLDNNKEKKVSFGAKSYRDFTLINNKNSEFYLPKSSDRESVKSAYRKRHQKDLLTDANKKGLGAGALSYYILWNKPSIESSIIDFKNKFNL